MTCGGFKLVPQETRRAHQLRDKLALARAGPVPPTGNPTRAPLSASSTQNTTPPARVLETSAIPNHEELPLNSENTELSSLETQRELPSDETNDARVETATGRGAELDVLLAAAAANPSNVEADRPYPLESMMDEDVANPIMDDNWEDPWITETEGLPDTPADPPPAPQTISPAVAALASAARRRTVPVASHVPDHKRLKNEPDPFNHANHGLPTAEAVDQQAIHPHAGIRLLYMLVTWLHLQFHLPFRACSALIGVVLLIIHAFGVTVDPPPLTTLPRIMSRLRVEPRFDVFTVCPSCLEVYPSDTDSTCTVCSAFLFKPNAPGTAAKKIPFLRFPSQSLESQIRSMLEVPGMEAELDSWRSKTRTPGRKIDIFDGKIPKQLPTCDGDLFFRNEPGDEKGPEGELRIGLTLGVDWFSYLRSQIAPSHSSCPMSFNVANLPPHLRYRTSNLLLAGIMPGPKEQDPDQCQRFLRISVNELLWLWKEGIIVPTESCPLGRLVQIILIAICCDKPAAHKIGGFGSHAHTFFCTMCWITQNDKESPKAYAKDGFPPRTDKQQREYGEQYANCTTNSERDDFVKKYATRWTEFARLPYFDLMRMVVIDPMHNLILGLVKTHFYHIWVQGKILRKTKELKAFHDFLAQFQMPAYLGRLPTLMGVPAGGSLTADQWLLMATVVGPIAVPHIWDEFMLEPDEARRQREQAIASRVAKKKRAAELRKQKAAEKKMAAQAAQAAGEAAPAGKRKRTKDVEDEIDDDEDVQSCLHPDDPANFLKLCQALRILISREVTDIQVEQADILLREYCTELLTLYGPDVMRPNHHYATHTASFVRDFGPLHGFWTFLFERLNKVLKSYRTNNHNGGVLETTFFREFQRTILTSRSIAKAAAKDGSDENLFQSAVTIMYSASADDRGTVQALSRELDSANQDDGVVYRLSPYSQRQKLGHELYYRLLLYMKAVFPQLGLRSLTETDPSPGGFPLPPLAMFHDYVVVRQHRYHALNKSAGAQNSLVEAFVSQLGDTWAGELLDIIQITLGNKDCYMLGHFRWFRPLRIDVRNTVWSAFISTGVKLWHENLYLGPDEPGPPLFLPLHFVKNHVARYGMEIQNTRAWATIGITKN